MKAEFTGIILAVAAVVVESVAQLLLKVGAAGGPAIIAPFYRRRVERLPGAASAKRWIGLGLLAYGLEILLYTLALHYLDVSVAFPLGSLCFVGVALLSSIFLGEAVGRIRWIGVSCILAGAICVTL